MDQIEQAVEKCDPGIGGGAETRDPTRTIGAKVMEKLHEIDPIAYVRYASVYRQFQEIGDFIEEIQTYEKRAGRTTAQPELFNAS